MSIILLSFIKKITFISGIIFLLYLVNCQHLFSFGTHVKNDTVNRKSFEPEVGEELVYKVSYAFFSLGEIRLKVLEKNVSGDKVTYKTQAFIDSYKGIPFVDLHEIYESTWNHNIYSSWFRSRTVEKSKTSFVTYNFDYVNKKVYFEFGKWGSSAVETRDTASVDTFAQDGLSLFYFARQNIFLSLSEHTS